MKQAILHRTWSRHSFIALHIARRWSWMGSLTTLLLSLNTMVGQLLVSSFGQCGRDGTLGSPLLAKAIQAALIFSIRAGASGASLVRLATFSVSNTKGISTVWGEMYLPPSIGDFQVT